MNQVHKVTNGEGKITGWAVVANGCELIGTYETVEAACKAADGKANANTLSALKTLPSYSETAVQVVMAPPVLLPKRKPLCRSGKTGGT